MVSEVPLSWSQVCPKAGWEDEVKPVLRVSWGGYYPGEQWGRAFSCTSAQTSAPVLGVVLYLLILNILKRGWFHSVGVSMSALHAECPGCAPQRSHGPWSTATPPGTSPISETKPNLRN